MSNIMKKLASTSLLALCLSLNVQAELELGPLKPLIGSWKSAPTGGFDMAPGQEGSKAGKGGPAVEAYFETMTFEVAADATNASDQYLTAVYYKQEVFKKSTGNKFHDQRGYFIYDAKNKTVYNSFCVPRATCVVAQGKAGSKMTLTAPVNGVAESSYMTKNAKTVGFTMNIEISDNKLSYSQVTNLEIYGKPFGHTDSGTLVKVAE